MCKETRFFIYLIERYARYKGRTADQILKEWDALDLTDFIYDMYEIYHVERLQNAFDDIDVLISEKMREDHSGYILDGLEDVKAGRTVDGESAIRDVRKKYGI